MNSVRTLIILVNFAISCQAQVDTSFWFVAPDISAVMGDTAIKLHFQTYSQSSVIYIRQPANLAGVNTSVSVNSNTLFTLNLSPSLTAVESSPTNSVSNKGLYISSKENISVYYSLGASTNREMIALKGKKALGTDFYAPIPTSTAVLTNPVFDGGIGFDAVATATGVTTILITPRAACVGRSKNITFVRTLTMGQTFSLRDNNSVNPSELSGSIIASDKPIAVTINGPVRTSPTCNSYFAEQITSSQNIGKEYVVLKGDGTVDVAYILAPANASSFTVTNSSSSFNWLINSGETFSISISDPITYIQCDKPIYVIHASGYGCKLSATQLAPAFCAGSYTTAFTRFNSDSLYLNLYTRTGFQNSFTLTSNSTNIPIAGSSFTTVPGSGSTLMAARLYYSTLTIPVGSHNELSNKDDLFGLGVRNGGSVSGSTYGTASEFGVVPFVYAHVIPTATICTNTQFTLNGVIGGGPLTGAWNIINGLGTLSGAVNQLTNNVYTPSALDTIINPIRIVLHSTGVCPNRSDTLKLTVKQSPIVSAGSNSISCSNNPTLQLSGNVFGATNQGVWNVVAPGNGSFSPNTNIFSPLYTLSNSDKLLSQLQFVLTSTNNAGCNLERDTIDVIINQPATVTASPLSPILKCTNNATVFLNGTVSGTTTSTGVWTTNGTGIFIPNNLSLINNYVPSALDMVAGNVWLKLMSTNNLQCFPVADSVQVVFSQPALASAGIDLNSCQNNPSVLLNANITGTNTSTGIWYGGGGTFLPSTTVLTPTYVASAAEVLTGTVALSFSTTNNGLCIGTNDQVIVTFQSKPTASFQVNSVCLNENTLFKDASFNASSIGVVNGWYWSFGDGSPLTGSVNPIHNYASTGVYSVQLIVRNTFDCYDTTQKQVEIYSLPSSSFSVERECTGPAQLIKFKDLSTISLPDSIPVSGYYWDFGGFGVSFAKDTSVIFPSEGIYNITHIVKSNHNCSALSVQSVTITPRPQARFIYTNNSTESLGAFVEFKDTSSYAVTWHWDFGNGDTSNLENPTAFYNANGVYTVVLTIADVFGCPSTFTSQVTVKTVVSDITKLIPNMITPNFDGKNDLWRLDFIQVFYPSAEIDIFNRWGVKIFSSIGYSNAWDGTYKGDALPVGAYFYTIKLNDTSNTPVFKGTVTLLK